MHTLVEVRPGKAWDSPHISDENRRLGSWAHSTAPFLNCTHGVMSPSCEWMLSPTTEEGRHLLDVWWNYLWGGLLRPLDVWWNYLWGAFWDHIFLLPIEGKTGRRRQGRTTQQWGGRGKRRYALAFLHHTPSTDLTPFRKQYQKSIACTWYCEGIPTGKTVATGVGAPKQKQQQE